jgi:hypothetical protein
MKTKFNDAKVVEGTRNFMLENQFLVLIIRK